MPIGSDFNIDYTLKTISHSSGATVYSVNALYSYLQDTFDAQGQMDDTIPMSAQTPTEYTLTNGWFIGNASTRYLTGGAIQTNAATNDVFVITYTDSGGALASFVETDIGKSIIQAINADSGSLLDYDTDNIGRQRAYIRASSSNDTFATAGGFIVQNGTGVVSSSAAAATGEDIFTNIYTLGTLTGSTSLYIEQSSSIIYGVDSNWWSLGHIDVLLKVQEADIPIDSSDIIVYAREYGASYDHFAINVPGGRNAVPLSTAADGFNVTDAATIGPLSASVSMSFGSYQRDLDNGNGFQDYKVLLDCGGLTLANAYEYTKFATQDLVAPGQSEDYDIDFLGSAVTGSIYRGASGSFTEVKAAPFGSYTGTFFGARGVWIANMAGADVQNISLIDSSGSTQTPPNTVTVSISSVSQSDRVGVFRLLSSGGEINKSEYLVSGSDTAGVNDSGSFILHVSGTISSDVPKASIVRIGEEAYAFSTWVNTTTGVLSGSFTLTDGLTVDYLDTSGSYIPIIDSIVPGGAISTRTNTLVQSNNIPVIIRVRQKGIIPFEIEGTINSSGLSQAAIRTIDTIVT